LGKEKSFFIQQIFSEFITTCQLLAERQVTVVTVPVIMNQRSTTVGPINV